MSHHLFESNLSPFFSVLLQILLYQLTIECLTKAKNAPCLLLSFSLPFFCQSFRWMDCVIVLKDMNVNEIYTPSIHINPNKNLLIVWKLLLIFWFYFHLSFYFFSSLFHLCYYHPFIEMKTHNYILTPLYSFSNEGLAITWKIVHLFISFSFFFFSILYNKNCHSCQQNLSLFILFPVFYSNLFVLRGSCNIMLLLLLQMIFKFPWILSCFVIQPFSWMVSLYFFVFCYCTQDLILLKISV